MEEPLGNIKEVQEGGKHLANWYLDHGYTLLAIQAGARARPFPNEGQESLQFYVRRNPIYVVGRPDGVESAPPYPGRERPKEEVKQ
jgi:hypothetical protein